MNLIAAFKGFAAAQRRVSLVDRLDAIRAEAERRRIDAMPDNVPSYNKDGKLVCYRPNWDKPGMSERVRREAFEDHWAANPPRGSTELRVYMREALRLEDNISKEKNR